jgi:hypothetical protein
MTQAVVHTASRSRPARCPERVRLITPDQIDFGSGASTAVVSGTQRFILPVPAFKDGGEPLVFPDGERAGQPVMDWQGKPVGGSGLVFLNAVDRTYQAVRGDGQGVVIIGFVSRHEAERIVAKVLEFVSHPDELTLDQFKEVLRHAREDLGLCDMYDSNREFVATKMSKVAPDTGVSAFGLHKRDERDVCRAVYVPGNGEFRGPAATPQKFAQGAIILKQGSNVRLIQPSAFEASYTYADGRPLSISEVAVQSPAAS